MSTLDPALQAKRLQASIAAGGSIGLFKDYVENELARANTRIAQAQTWEATTRLQGRIQHLNELLILAENKPTIAQPAKK